LAASNWKKALPQRLVQMNSSSLGLGIHALGVTGVLKDKECIIETPF